MAASVISVLFLVSNVLRMGSALSLQQGLVIRAYLPFSSPFPSFSCCCLNTAKVPWVRVGELEGLVAFKIPFHHASSCAIFTSSAVFSWSQWSCLCMTGFLLQPLWPDLAVALRDGSGRVLVSTLKGLIAHWNLFPLNFFVFTSLLWH